jgi:replicative DNA helicase
MLYRNQLINNDSLTTSQQLESEPIELILAKHRNGPTGIIKLHFDERRMKFHNIKS